MATFTMSGAVLGVRRTPYDFTDDDGKQVKGESYALVLYDADAVRSHEVKIKRDVAGKFVDIPQGTVITVAVDVFANLDKGGKPFLSITAADLLDA